MGVHRGLSALAAWSGPGGPPIGARDADRAYHAAMTEEPPFERFDFLYSPSRDVEADARFLTEVAGGRLVFAIEDMETRVAMVELAEGPPRLLLADHVEGDRPIMVFRVRDLDGALSALSERGWKPERRLEIPHGPCCSFRTPGGHRVAIYQLTRPGVAAHFEGRRDF